MRRWLHRLHGGQFAMLLGAVLLLGVAVIGIGFDVGGSAEQNALTAHAIRTGDATAVPDPVGARLFEDAAQRGGRFAAFLVFSGATACCVGLVMLWSWFGSRRRTT